MSQCSEGLIIYSFGRMQVYRERETVAYSINELLARQYSSRLKAPLGPLPPRRAGRCYFSKQTQCLFMTGRGKTLNCENGLGSGPATSFLHDFGQVPNLSEPQLSHQYNGDNIYFSGLFWGSCEVMMLKSFT